MGNLSSLPALAVQPPAAPRDPLEEYARVAQIKSQQQSQQLQAQQMQLNQQKIADEQATTKAMQEWDPASGDYQGLAKKALQYGASGSAADGIVKGGMELQKNTMAMTDEKRKQFIEGRKAVADALGEHKDIPDDQLQGWTMAQISDLANNKFLDPAHANQLQQITQSVSDPAQLHARIDQYVKGNLGAAAVAGQQKTEGETREHNAKASNEEAEAGLNNIKLNLAKNSTPGSYDADIDKIYNPNSTTSGGQNRMLKGLINSALQRGDTDSAKKYVDQALENQQGISKEISVATNPKIHAEKVDLVRQETAERIKQQSALLDDTAKKMAAQMYAQTGQLPAGMRSPGMAAGILNTAAGSDPNATPDIAANKRTYAAQTALQKSATSGEIGKNITAYNTAIAHAGQLRDAANALDNDDTRLLNKVGNTLGYQFGSDKTTNFNVIKNALSGEIAKVFKGDATDAEIKAVQEPFSSANSPAQLKGAIDNAVHLMNSKRDALKQQVEQGMKGLPNFDPQPAQSAPASGSDFFSQFGGKPR
jgi:hypothetical protein